MLEYNLDDAEKLLQKNLDAATSSLAQVEEDLSFIRDQTTTVEVSILFQHCNNYSTGLVRYSDGKLELGVLIPQRGRILNAGQAGMLLTDIRAGTKH